VIAREILAVIRLFFKIAWCDQVTDAPEANKITVLRSGTCIGLKELIELGGQFCPISILGLILLWKYAQKNDMKNKTSDVINKIIPIFNPVTTLEGCSPWIAASRAISRHHWYAVMAAAKVAINIGVLVLYCIQGTVEITIPVIEVAAISGQGLILTIWNLW
jgi:hypothetical protein